MTNQEVLIRAIEKAIANGWEPTIKQRAFRYKAQTFVYPDFPYSHDFAKALWGISPLYEEKNGKLVDLHMPRWEYMLQQMVIAEDPIAYLGKNI